MSLKEWRKKRIAEGGCVSCRNPAVAGKKMCQFHLDKSAEYERKRSAAKEKPCTRCGAATTKMMCQRCASSVLRLRYMKRLGYQMRDFSYDVDSMLSEIEES